jgi:uncharacterized protein YjbI with pentapeptide repeats
MVTLADYRAFYLAEVFSATLLANNVGSCSVDNRNSMGRDVFLSSRPGNSEKQSHGCFSILALACYNLCIYWCSFFCVVLWRLPSCSSVLYLLLEDRPGNISSEKIPVQFPEVTSFQKLAPWIFAFFNVSPFPHLIGAELSTKPANWDGNSLAAVVGARLEERFLRYADAAGAFLANADLRSADLERANLLGVDLRGSNLVGTKLVGAYLMTSKLQGAELTGADLREAFLLETDLREVRMLGTNAEKTCLNGANLMRADLQQANFQCADFRPANMAWTRLYDYKWGESEGKVTIIFLQGANFQGATLKETRLEGARLVNKVLDW